MSKWIAEFELEDGDTMPEHMDLEYQGARLDFHCKPKKIGHWIFEGQRSDWFEEMYKCSHCNRRIIVPGGLSGEELYEEYPYCHCGAKMQEVEE